MVDLSTPAGPGARRVLRPDEVEQVPEPGLKPG